ncbi:MAG: hypothetical protein ACXVBC_14270, partial [Bdellovibrionota bacterium]
MSKLRVTLAAGLLVIAASARAETQATQPSASAAEIADLKRRIEALERGTHPQPNATQVPSEIKERIDTVEETMQHRLDWSGEIDANFNYYNAKGTGGEPQQEAFVYSRLKPKFTFMEGASATSDILFRADAGNPARDTVRIEEAYGTVPIGSHVKIRAGKMIYTWGSALSYNPTDFLNPYDFYDFMHVDKLGVLAADVTITANEKFSVQVGVLPLFQPSIIADSTSRWIDFTSVIKTALIPHLALPAGTPSNFGLNFQIGNNIPQTPQAFVRFAFRPVWFDFSLMYSFRYDPIPTDMLFSSTVTFDVVNNTPQITVQGNPFYSLEHVIGASLSVPFLTMVGFADCTLSIPVSQQSAVSPTQEASDLNNLGITSVSASDIAGLRRFPVFSFAAGLRKDWSKVHLALEYAQTIYTGPVRAGSLFTVLVGSLGGSVGGLSPTSVYDFFSGAIMPGFSWDITSKVTFRTGGIYNWVSHGYLANAGFEFKPIEGFKL